MDPSTIGCSQCGKFNIQEAKFCWSCRKPIVIPESSSTAITRSTRPPPGTQVIDFTSDPESPQKGLFGRHTLPRSTSARVALRPPFQPTAPIKDGSFGSSISQKIATSRKQAGKRNLQKVKVEYHSEYGVGAEPKMEVWYFSSFVFLPNDKNKELAGDGFRYKFYPSDIVPEFQELWRQIARASPAWKNQDIYEEAFNTRIAALAFIQHRNHLITTPIDDYNGATKQDMISEMDQIINETKNKQIQFAVIIPVNYCEADPELLLPLEEKIIIKKCKSNEGLQVSSKTEATKYTDKGKKRETAIKSKGREVTMKQEPKGKIAIIKKENKKEMIQDIKQEKTEEAKEGPEWFAEMLASGASDSGEGEDDTLLEPYVEHEGEEQEQEKLLLEEEEEKEEERQDSPQSPIRVSGCSNKGVNKHWK